MSESPIIIFYDIPCQSTTCKAWSPNTWRARFALNIKGLKYKTEWVEYPDIEDLYKKLGIEAVDKNSDGSPYYTLPVVHDPSTNSTVADSYTIVKYLDKTYPNTPVLLPKGTLVFHAAFETMWGRVRSAIFYLVVSAVCDCLNPRSQEFFRTTREMSLGKKLEEARGEEQWAHAERALGFLADWLDKDEEGKEDLVMGDRICCADLTVAGNLMWAYACLGAESEDWKRICGWHGGRWKAVVDRFAKYASLD